MAEHIHWKQTTNRTYLGAWDFEQGKDMIVQIKEKFGYLRWYDNGCTERWYSEILPKYEALSERTCIRCGKKAAFISTGWISPWCEECAQGIRDRMVPIDEWFGEEEGDPV